MAFFLFNIRGIAVEYHWHDSDCIRMALTTLHELTTRAEEIWLLIDLFSIWLGSWIVQYNNQIGRMKS